MGANTVAAPPTQRADDEMPPGWRRTTLDELVERLYSGGTPSTREAAFWSGSTPWITGADIVGQKVTPVRRHVTAAAILKGLTQVVPKGGVLIVTRTGVGKVAVAPFDVAVSQDITGAIPKPDQITGDYLYWWLTSNGSQLARLNQGTSINGVVREDLARLQVSVPPIQEQQRIAEVLSSVQAAIEKTDTVIDAAERLRQALTHELLTMGVPGWHHEWKHVPGIGTLPADWQIARLGAVAEVTAGFALGPDRRPRINPKPYLTVANVKAGGVIIGDRRYMEVTPKEYGERHVVAGDLVVVEGHAQLSELGRAAIVPPEADGFTFQNHLFRVRGDSARCTNKYLCCYINAPGGRAYFRSFGGTTSGLNTVSASNVRAMPVPLPGIEEQHRVNALLDAVDNHLKTNRMVHVELVTVKNGLADGLLSGRIRTSVEIPVV